MSITVTNGKLNKYRTSKTELQKLDSAKKDAIKLAETKIGATLPPDLTKKIEEDRSELETLGRQVTEESQKLQGLDRSYHEVENAVSSLTDFSKKLRLELGVSEQDKSSPVKELIDKARLRLVELDSKAARYKNEKTLDDFKLHLSKLREILDYLKSEEEVLTVEKDLPNTNAQIQEMTARINSLQQLEGSLAAIREVAMGYQKEAVSSELSSIETTMNHYYKLLAGHPVFQELQLSMNDQKEPIVYSIRAVGPDASTHIPTRFRYCTREHCSIFDISLQSRQIVEAVWNNYIRRSGAKHGCRAPTEAGSSDKGILLRGIRSSLLRRNQSSWSNYVAQNQMRVFSNSRNGPRTVARLSRQIDKKTRSRTNQEGLHFLSERNHKNKKGSLGS